MSDGVADGDFGSLTVPRSGCKRQSPDPRWSPGRIVEERKVPLIEESGKELNISVEKKVIKVSTEKVNGLNRK